MNDSHNGAKGEETKMNDGCTEEDEDDNVLAALIAANQPWQGL